MSLTLGRVDLNFSKYLNTNIVERFKVLACSDYSIGQTGEYLTVAVRG